MSNLLAGQQELCLPTFSLLTVSFIKLYLDPFKNLKRILPMKSPYKSLACGKVATRIKIFVVFTSYSSYYVLQSTITATSCTTLILLFIVFWQMCRNTCVLLGNLPFHEDLITFNWQLHSAFPHFQTYKIPDLFAAFSRPNRCLFFLDLFNLLKGCTASDAQNEHCTTNQHSVFTLIHSH